jgi:hypothetical protein
MKVDQFSEYHCTAEWHISRMKSRWALAVYNFALRISKESGVFFCSAVGLAEYFGCNERSIRRAYEQLLEAGFFELTGQAPFEANVYKAIPHRVWAERNPGQCVTRLASPWSGECDQLGQKLWVVSGGRARFRPYQIKFLKRLGLSEEEIVSEFEAFWFSHSRSTRADQFKSNRRLLIGQFIDLMKEKAGRSRVVV